MSMQNIKNIVFDVGMVLIDFCWKKYCEELGFSNEVIEAFGKYMVLTEVWDQLDEGTISLEDAKKIFKDAMPQYVDEIDGFWRKMDNMVAEYPYALPMIEELKQKGYQVYLLSNYPLDMYQCHWPQFRFFNCVDGYIVSAIEKLRKPNPAIYELLCSRYHLNPKDCLFVDDRKENVDAAIGCGWEGYVFSDYDAFRTYMSEVGVL